MLIGMLICLMLWSVQMSSGGRGRRNTRKRDRERTPPPPSPPVQVPPLADPNQMYGMMREMLTFMQITQQQMQAQQQMMLQ